MNNLPTTLEGAINHLAENGWHSKLVTRTLPDGTVGYVASIWREDALGGGRKYAAASPKMALIGALLDARKHRRRRSNALKRRRIAAEQAGA